jgi:ABC-type glycerol-3-phosphate transport system substrate-binding protein
LSAFEAQNTRISVSVIADNTQPADVILYNPLSDILPPLSSETQLCADINVLFYNINALRNIRADRPPKTREDFTTVCRKLRASGTLRPFAFSAGVFQSILPWFYQGGIDTTRDDMAETAAGWQTINWSDKDTIATLAFLQELVRGRLASLTMRDGDSALSAFLTGRAAMMIAPVSTAKRIDAAKVGFEYGITTIPAPDGYRGQSVLNLSLLSAGVTASSAEQDAANALLAFLAEHVHDIAQALGAVPGALNATNDAVSTPSGTTSALMDKADDLYSGAFITNDTTSSGALRFEATLQQALVYLWSNACTPKGAAAFLRAQFQQDR